MAKISYWQIPEEWKPLVEKVLMWGDRYNSVNIRRKPLFSSRKRKKGLTLKSLTPLASEQWALLSPTQKSAWASAGASSNLTSFQLFLRDISARINNDLPYPGTPSDIVQTNVGRAQFIFPAAGFLIKQEHPFQYFILRKVRGTRDQYEPIEVLESFDLPLELGISYRTDLTAVGPNPVARFYVEIISNYQGRDISTIRSIDFGLSDPWTRETLLIENVVGRVRSYTVYIDVQDCSGTMEWDNVKIFHSGVNWARDPRCDAVGTSYTGSFFQIAKNWEPVIQPPGAFFDSIYYNI